MWQYYLNDVQITRSYEFSNIYYKKQTMLENKIRFIGVMSRCVHVLPKIWTTIQNVDIYLLNIILDPAKIIS